MQIDQARANHEALDIHSFNIRWCLRCDAGTERRDFAIQDQQVCDGIKTVCGVEDTTACEQERIHARVSISRGCLSSSVTERKRLTTSGVELQ